MADKIPTEVPQPILKVETIVEVRRTGFLFMTKKTRTIEVTYAYKAPPKSVGETLVPPPLWIEEAWALKV